MVAFLLGSAVISGMQVEGKLHKDMLGTPIKPDSCLLCDMENSCFSNRTKLHPVFLRARESQIWFYVSWVMCFNIVQQMFNTWQIFDAHWMNSTYIAQHSSKIGDKALISCHPCFVILKFWEVDKAERLRLRTRACIKPKRSVGKWKKAPLIPNTQIALSGSTWHSGISFSLIESWQFCWSLSSFWCQLLRLALQDTHVCHSQSARIGNRLLAAIFRKFNKRNYRLQPGDTFRLWAWYNHILY